MCQPSFRFTLLTGKKDTKYLKAMRYLLVTLLFALHFGCQTHEKQGEPMRALLVDNLYSILTVPAEKQNFLDFVARFQFSELTFYTSGPENARAIPLKMAEFNDLINRSLSLGVTRIQIAIGSTREMDRVVSFIDTYQAKVNGFWVEYEWWNNAPRDFYNAKSLIAHIRANGGGRTIGTYIGWVSQEEMTELTNIVDFIYIHSYVPNGSRTYSRVKSRLDLIRLARPSRKARIMPIFSAEWLPPEMCDQGPQANPSFYDQYCFMGPWLRDNGGVIGAEKAFNAAKFTDRTGTVSWRNYATIRGFYYFSYTNLKKVLMP